MKGIDKYTEKIVLIIKNRAKKKVENNSYHEYWVKSINEMDESQLLEKLTQENNYEEQYLELIKKRLITVFNYDEEKLRTVVESAQKGIQEEMKTSIHGWLRIFLLFIIWWGFSYLYKIATHNIANHDGKMFIYRIEVLLGIMFLALAVFTVIAFYRRQVDAFYLGRMYIVNILIIDLLFIFHISVRDISVLLTYDTLSIVIYIARFAIWPLIWPIIWLMYLTFSDQVKKLMPTQNRKWLKRDTWIMVFFIIIQVVYSAGTIVEERINIKRNEKESKLQQVQINEWNEKGLEANNEGKYEEAIYYFELSLKEYEKWGVRNLDYGLVLNYLACLYSDLGCYSKTIELGEKSLEIIKEIQGKNSIEYATSLNDLVFCHLSHGDYAKAVESGEKSLGIIKKIKGKKSSEYATSLENLAFCHFNHGDYVKAVELGEKSLETIKEIKGEYHIDYAFSLNQLATYYSANNIAKAIELEEQSLEKIMAIMGEYHLECAEPLYKLSFLYLNLGDYAKAFDYFLNSIDCLYRNILFQFSQLTSHQREKYWAEYSYNFTDIYPSFACLPSFFQTTDLYDKSALFAKGLLLNTEIEMNRLIQESGDEEAVSMFEELKQKRLMLQKLYEKPIAERVLKTDSLEQEADKLESELVKRSQVYGDFSRKLRTTWKDVQAALDEDEVAVEFLSFGNKFMGNSTMVVALTLRKDDKEPKMIPLFEQEQMEKVKDIKISRDRSVRKTKTFYSQEVTDLVWKPMAEELKGIKRIYFSAAGILHKVGIEYAPGMEDYDIYRLSTTREVIDMKENSRKSLTAQSDAILYGGVDYEVPGKSKAQKAETKNGQKNEDDTHRSISIDLHHAFIDSLKVRGTDLKYLPGTLDEVKHISSCFDQKHRRAITGTDATETSVKSLPEKLPRILHIATHGFYYTEKEKARMDVRKGLLLDNEHRLAGRHEDEALNRSGLFMAGANRALKGEPLPMEADDGILTAQEIAKIDLRGVDLVVLSACETGQGDIYQGEGVYGLQRGFKKAGVNTIMMSLWKVSDKATEILMTEFYKQVCAGKNKHESLRMAQKKVREYKNSEGKLLFEDPFFWAGFILLD